MAAAVFRASAVLPASATKVRAAGRASSSSSWIKDKLERESLPREGLSSRIKIERRSPRERLSLCGSTIPGRASLSKNWTCDKLERSRRIETEVLEARQQEEDSAARQAVSYYAGPAFNNSPDPSELAIPVFIKSPDPSEVCFPVTRSMTWFPCVHQTVRYRYHLSTTKAASICHRLFIRWC